MSVDKAFAALGIGAAGSVGTYFLVHRSGGDREPNYKLVSALTTIPADYNSSSNKIGKDFAHFLVAVDEEENKDWWTYSLERLKANLDSLDEEFKKVDKAFATGADAKALNKVCESFYKKAKTEITGNNGKEKKRINLFTYCSPMKGEPRSVQQSSEDEKKHNYDGSKVGKQKETTVASTENPENEVFWRLKTEEFFAKGDSDFNSDTFFKSFHTKHKDKKENRPSLKEHCKKAYALEAETGSSTNDKPKADETPKYCSLMGQ